MEHDEGLIEEAVVITGASRGIGAALARQMLAPTRLLVCISRSTNKALVDEAGRTDARLDWFEQDLANVQRTDALAREVFARIASLAAQGTLRRVLLINNAGLVQPIGLASEVDGQRASTALQVNVLAAISFTGALLAATDEVACERRILNISSGAGRRPTPGWSVYCSTKAALDMYTRCVKAEQAGHSNPARLCSLAPGVVDTGMQEQIRATSAEQFPGVDRFRGLKESGGLASAEETAQRILAYLARADFGEVEVDDVRA